MFHITGKARRADLSLSFKHVDKVVDFVTELETRFLKTTNPTELPTSVAAPLIFELETHQSYGAAAVKSADVCTLQEDEAQRKEGLSKTERGAKNSNLRQ